MLRGPAHPRTRTALLGMRAIVAVRWDGRGRARHLPSLRLPLRETVTMLDWFTDAGRRVLVLAQEEARHLDHGHIGTEHILLGLISEGVGVAAQVLESMGISLDRARQDVADVADVVGPVEEPATGSPPFTPRAKKVLELAVREACRRGHSYVGTEHLLLGLVREGEGVAARVLVGMGADLHRVRTEVIQRLAKGTTMGRDAAVAGDLVERRDIPVGAAALLGWEDATALLLSGPLLADARTERSEVDGILYETCTYNPRRPPEISVAVAGATVTREAFDDSTSRSVPDAELIDGVGDAATYSRTQASLRVLVGSTVFVVKIRRHPHPRSALIQAASRVLARMSPPQT